MSHIVEIQTEIRDPVAMGLASERLGIPQPVQGSFALYRDSAEGWGEQLPGWKYPVVCSPETGKLSFDHFEGRWGDPRELDRFLQAYAVEKAKLEARRQGYSVSEESLSDGSIKLVVQLDGGVS